MVKNMAMPGASRRIRMEKASIIAFFELLKLHHGGISRRSASDRDPHCPANLFKNLFSLIFLEFRKMTYQSRSKSRSKSGVFCKLIPWLGLKVVDTAVAFFVGLEAYH